MQTVTAKEAKNRLGQVIDLALAEKAVAISKNGRDAVVLVSAEYFRELSGKQGFIQDSHATEKNKRRKEFAKAVGQGRAKSTDASMFKGIKSAVKFGNEEF
jgi:prevent-host-death family protein